MTTVPLANVQAGQVLRRDGWPVAVAEVAAVPGGVSILWEDGTRSIPLHPSTVYEIAGAQLSLADEAATVPTPTWTQATEVLASGRY